MNTRATWALLLPQYTSEAECLRGSQRNSEGNGRTLSVNMVTLVPNSQVSQIWKWVLNSFKALARMCYTRSQQKMTALSFNFPLNLSVLFWCSFQCVQRYEIKIKSKFHKIFLLLFKILVAVSMCQGMSVLSDRWVFLLLGLRCFFPTDDTHWQTWENLVWKPTKTTFFHTVCNYLCLA